jgi:hypothetical protein
MTSTSSNIEQQIVDLFEKELVGASALQRGIDDQWAVDLVDMNPKVAKENNGFRYMLTVVDAFSKYAWVVPLRTKTKIKEALEEIFEKSGRIPTRIQADKGTEFYNKEVQPFLASKNITLFSTESELKAVIVERFNRTLKQRLGKLFNINGNQRFIDVVQRVVKSYNNTYHSSIKMKPTEASKPKNATKVYLNLYGDLIKKEQKPPKYKVGDFVRIPTYKNIFSKEVALNKGNFTIEVFQIRKVNTGKPNTYLLKDLLNEEILGQFYEWELNDVPQSVLDKPFTVDKVIRRRTRNGVRQAFVSFEGYPPKFNQWVDSIE